MAALPAGKPAPDFTLPTVEGKKVSLHSVLAKGPVVLVFFKINCPVCQYAIPYVDRVKGSPRLQVYAVTQDDAESTAEFNQDF